MHSRYSQTLLNKRLLRKIYLKSPTSARTLSTLGAERMKSSQLAALGELAAGIAHEINNPVNSIINYAQILSDENHLRARERHIVEQIMGEGIRISAIVRNLLSLTGFRAEERKLSSVEDLLSCPLELTGALCKKEGISILLNIPPNIDKITVNIQLMQQVFLNLVNNARYALNLKYPQPCSEKILEIKAECRCENSIAYVCIIFFDHGAGIAESALNKVMNPFFTTKPKNEGTGLGLSVSHAIIKEHGGKLTIESREGEYTLVTVWLPSWRNNEG